MSAAPLPATKAPGWSLRLRIVSSILFLPLLILLARAGGLAFTGFVALQVFLGLREFYRMMRGKGLHPGAMLGLLASLGILLACYKPHLVATDALMAGLLERGAGLYHDVAGEVLVTGLVLLMLAISLRHPERPRQVESLGVTLLGILYVGWLSAHLVLLRELPWIAGTAYPEGASYVLLAFFVTWSCDTGAYTIGRLFGRTRPWTTISPRKSLEGAAGGLLAAILAAFIARAWFARYLGPWDSLVIGATVGVFGQVGDFVESLLKRDATPRISSPVTAASSTASTASTSPRRWSTTTSASRCSGCREDGGHATGRGRRRHRLDRPPDARCDRAPS